MSARATNHAILFLLSVELLSGLTSFSIGRPGGSWIFWLHGIAGFSLVGLVIWKYRIIFRSFRRRGVASETVGSIILVLLFVGVLASGTLWAIIGRGSVEIPFYGNARLLVIHTTLGLALTIPLIVHAAMRWPRRVKRTDFTNRRAALRLLAVGLGGLVLWQGASAAAPVAGKRPRFTGSREEASGRGNAHPVTQWLFDRRQRIDADDWTLAVLGLVERPTRLSLPRLGCDRHLWHHGHARLHWRLVHGPGLEWRQAVGRVDVRRACVRRRERGDRIGNRVQPSILDCRDRSTPARHAR